MKTEMNKQHSFMIIIVMAGLIMAAIAFLKPVPAEAGVTVNARVGNVGISVSPDSPRGVVVQTGPRSFRYDGPDRPLRPVHGRYVWVPGHFEKILDTMNCRQYHKGAGFKPGKGRSTRTKVDHLDKGRRNRKAPRHSHYRHVWVPGHWERI